MKRERERKNKLRYGTPQQSSSQLSPNPSVHPHRVPYNLILSTKLAHSSDNPVIKHTPKHTHTNSLSADSLERLDRLLDRQSFIIEKNKPCLHRLISHLPSLQLPAVEKTAESTLPIILVILPPREEALEEEEDRAIGETSSLIFYPLLFLIFYLLRLFFFCLPLLRVLVLHILPPFVVVAGCFNATYCTISTAPRVLPPSPCVWARRGEIKAFPLPHIPTKTYHIRLPCWRIYSFFSFLFPFSLSSPSFATSSDPCLPTSSSGEIFSLLSLFCQIKQKGFAFPVVIPALPPQSITVFTISSYPSSTLFCSPDTSAVTHQI